MIFKTRKYTEKVLTIPKQALIFTCLQYMSFENTVEKGEIARNEQFLLFPQCFLPFGELSAIFIKVKIVVCKLFYFGKVYNLRKSLSLKTINPSIESGP